MSERDLDRLLTGLRDELAKASFSDERSRQLAVRLMTETDELAAARAASKPPPSTLGDRLKGAVDHFEATHPDLSETMRRIVAALADAGL